VIDWVLVLSEGLALEYRKKIHQLMRLKKGVTLPI